MLFDKTNKSKVSTASHQFHNEMREPAVHGNCNWKLASESQRVEVRFLPIRVED